MAAEHVLLTYFGVFGIALTIIYLSWRNHETSSRKLAKIRVRVDDSRRHVPEPPDEEYERWANLDWLVIMSWLFLLMLFSAVE